jgi:hypothetical protein
MGRYSLKRKPPFQVKRGIHEPFAAAFRFLSEDLHMRLFHFEVRKVVAAITVKP